MVYTDNIQFAERNLPHLMNWQLAPRDEIEPNLGPLLDRLAPRGKLYKAVAQTDHNWPHIFFIEYATESQYDALVDFSRLGLNFAQKILCIAGSGKRFHGQRNRPWASLPGNLHLSAFLPINREIENIGAAFSVLPVVSVLQAIDSLETLKAKAMVKWVNDVFVEGAKVGGVLAHTQTQANIVSSAVLGIGLNVATRPQVPPSLAAPHAAALIEFVDDPTHCAQPIVFHRLLDSLGRNYQKLVAGEITELIEFYRKRSLAVGKTVRIFSDDFDSNNQEIAYGKVESIGENLELFLEGIEAPITKGRLAFDP